MNHQHRPPSHLQLLAGGKRPESQLVRAFEALRSQIEATPPRVLNVGWQHVARVVEQALAASAPFRAQLEALGDAIDLESIDALPERVSALGYAASRCLPAKRGAERQALRAEALTLRGRMQLELAAWARAGLRVPAPLRPLTRGAGHDELAGDLLKLAAQLRRVHASGHTGILTREEVAEVERLAMTLLRASETRREDDAALSDARLLRRKAYALVFDGYAELRAAMEFLLRRRPGAVDTLVPRLARVQQRFRKKRAAPPVAPPTSPRAPRF